MRRQRARRRAARPPAPRLPLRRLPPRAPAPQNTHKPALAPSLAPPQALPEDWQCPVCGGEKRQFKLVQREVAGFAENQGYGLGTNSMTGEQKSLLIFGSLGFFIFLFLAGYTMQ